MSGDVFIGEHPSVRAIFDMVALVAPTDEVVLASGETGTGKDLIVRSIQQESLRRDKPYVVVNCGAIADSLLDSELFGHLRGAFTGADQNALGCVAAADGGTLFLDEIGEMSRSMQVKLLRVLQSGEYTPVGSAIQRRCNVRFLAASNRNLSEMVARDEFREDLYYRISAFPISLPPLRERRSDIYLLITHFLKRCAEQNQRTQKHFTPEAERMLLDYSYPGNVRELDNIIRRAFIMSPGDGISAFQLPEHVRTAQARRVNGSEEAQHQGNGVAANGDSNSESHRATVALRGANGRSFHEAKAQVVEQFERQFLTEVLRDNNGMIRHAAACIGLSERNFHAKLKQYGINARSFRIGNSHK